MLTLLGKINIDSHTNKYKKLESIICRSLPCWDIWLRKAGCQSKCVWLSWACTGLTIVSLSPELTTQHSNSWYPTYHSDSLCCNMLVPWEHCSSKSKEHHLQLYWVCHFLVTTCRPSLCQPRIHCCWHLSTSSFHSMEPQVGISQWQHLAWDIPCLLHSHILALPL